MATFTTDGHKPRQTTPPPVTVGVAHTFGEPSPPRGIEVAPPLYYSFFGQLWSDPSQRRSFKVLAGEASSKITAGYPKWQVIDRPRMTGMTVFQGYDPPAIEIPMIFLQRGPTGGLVDNSASGVATERECAKLEWMAGRGASSVQGLDEPPRVWVTTYDRSGNVSPLIPFNYQSSAHAPSGLAMNQGMMWVINAIDWDDKDTMRNFEGYRILQKATVTLWAYVADTETARTSAAQRA